MKIKTFSWYSSVFSKLKNLDLFIYFEIENIFWTFSIENYIEMHEAWNQVSKYILSMSTKIKKLHRPFITLESCFERKKLLRATWTFYSWFKFHTDLHRRLTLYITSKTLWPRLLVNMVLMNCFFLNSSSIRGVMIKNI